MLKSYEDNNLVDWFFGLRPTSDYCQRMISITLFTSQLNRSNDNQKLKP